MYAVSIFRAAFGGRCHDVISASASLDHLAQQSFDKDHGHGDAETNENRESYCVNEVGRQ